MEVEGEDGGGGRREDMEGDGDRGRIWREKMEVEGLQSPYPPSSPSIFSLHLHLSPYPGRRWRIWREDGGYGDRREKMEGEREI